MRGFTVLATLLLLQRVFGWRPPRSNSYSRPGNNANVTIEDYVAAKDAQDAEETEEGSISVRQQEKKSNAVGDPDGEGSDSDDGSDWEEFEDSVEGGTSTQTTTSLPSPQVEVQLEFEQEEGGVSVMRSNRKRKKDSKKITKVDQQEIIQAWRPHIFSPPSTAALEYLTQHSRQIDGSSKTRLDRRTLYACLLLEWRNANTSYRKFLSKSTSQALRSSLSLATQPQWRRAYPRPNGISLYNNEKACTLAMQETIALALAHSFGCGMVILDDTVIARVRQKLLNKGFTEEDIKPAVLIQTLIAAANEGNLQRSGTGIISECMKHDLEVGLDDPYDERAMASCQEMIDWEEKWDLDSPTETPMPLVLFVRAQSSNSLLKSKSAVETLMRECNSEESVNLVVLGKGIDENTESLPEEEFEIPNEIMQPPPRNALNGAAPWFGFSPHNQNASGQNDPEGSRRFNIFLARTVDASGTPGILGAIAPPQAGNLFPHMMAMQARERLQNQDEESPVKAELERWAQLLQQQMQTGGGSPLPPPQFFNASLNPFNEPNNMMPNMRPPPPEVIQQTLQQAMSELLDRLANMNDENDHGDDLSPDLHKAFSQVLRNENLRRGIAENLARAAPALSDPKCQGVMLSVYVPPPPNHANRGRLPNGQLDQQPNMGGWFQKILNSQDQAALSDEDESSRKTSRQKRARTMAAAAAVLAAKKAQSSREGEARDNKAERNLSRLEVICSPVAVEKPADPVRAKSWESWISRERGSVIFRQNRIALNQELEDHDMVLQEHTGTVGAGSSLRQMLSVRDITDEMESVIRCAIELEASKSLSKHQTSEQIHESEMDLNVDITLSQLLVSGESFLDESSETPYHQYIHPSSLESALTMVCRITPSPGGGLCLAGDGQVSHRTKDEIAALAQDKHERALISQVVLPQDIGVTYDMIGGLTEVKELLRQSITYPLKFPHLYSEGIAREAVKGVLLFGPPGTGKTMLAKAVATEGGASFLSVDASSVENKWLGESEKNAKAVFTLARRLAPCVVFIDEVDSLLSSREGTSDDSAHGTLTSVKTTMMSEWDGLNSGTNGAGEAGSDRVVVIGSTNRPFDLDEAVLRRFPRRILVDLPDLETRQEILEVTLAENRVDPSVNFTQIAERLEGYTGSDIKEVCREAVVQISHEQAKMLDGGFADSKEDVTQGSLQRLRPVTNEDFEQALRKLKKSVSEKGRELQRVWEWNDEYGEIKKEKKEALPHLASMYL